jgi:tRNA(Ile)-lysidine synthase TilS/MesJ
MNFTYGGRIDTLSPVSYMDRSDMTIIRPMIYTTEKSNKSFIKEKQIPTMPIVCPVDKKTTREFMYNKIKEFEISNKQARANMMGAIKRSKVSGWHE